MLMRVFLDGRCNRLLREPLTVVLQVGAILRYRVLGLIFPFCLLGENIGESTSCLVEPACCEGHGALEVASYTWTSCWTVDRWYFHSLTVTLPQIGDSLFGK